jgi:diguanylate cyclase (GGDEF)-like protein
MPVTTKLMGRRTGNASQAVASASGVAAVVGSGRRRGWVVLAALLVVGGVGGAVFAAGSVARNDAEDSRDSLRSSSGEVASTLQLAIQHEQDLVVTAGAFVLANPHASNARFAQWLKSVQAFKRYPELSEAGYAVIVPAKDLPAFAARAVADPAGPLAANGSFQVIPPGNRPYYCLAPAMTTRYPGSRSPAGFDFCAMPLVGPSVLAARDFGQSSYFPLTIGGVAYLAVQTPIYRGGVTPATTDARREAFLSWIGMTTVPKFVLDRALQAVSNTAVAFRYRTSSSDVLFTSGKAPVGAQSVRIDLHNGWTVQTFGAVARDGVLENGNALATLIGGLLLSILLGVLVFVLGTGRARALRLAQERTAQAMHDALTGLPNRLLFADRATQVLAAARRDASMPVVLMLDLDRFKEVNDTLGHQHGDLLLQQVAQRLSGLLRQSETVARFGGDEFAVLLTEGGSQAGADVAARIASVLEEPFHLGEATVGVEASIGIAAVAAHEELTLEELLRQADIAMYKAKADRSGFAHFAACNDLGTPDRLTLIGELRQGLDCEELLLHYQPKIAVEGGELLGVEALVRWQHPTRGLLLPSEFIALAEGSTLIHRLTTLVLDMALRFARTCLDQGLRLPIAVNVSARSLFDPGFPTIIADRLTHAGVSADLLTIELTEGTVMAYPDLALDILKKLRDMGVHLSVDDYGTGYSTLAYLKNLPVHELKIDRAFITGLTTDHNDEVIVKSAMDLGHDLGLSIVAEGVEDEATLLALKALGVDVAQGFYLGRPMPENLLRQWIADHSDALMLLTEDPVRAGDASHENVGGSAGRSIKGRA